MAFSNFVLLLFIISLAALFGWKALRPETLSWLNLALIVVLGGWCGILVWSHNNISSTITAHEQTLELLNDGNLAHEYKSFLQQQVKTYPSRINSQMYDHYYYFTGFGWLISGSYFVLLTSFYGALKKLFSTSNRPIDKQ